MVAITKPGMRIGRRGVLGAAGAGAFIALTGGVRLAVPKGVDADGFRQFSSVSGSAYPFTIDDPSGLRQTLERPPQRILSSSYPSDEALALLVPNHRVLSVSDGVDKPEINNAAGHYPPDVPRNQGLLEETIALRPDFVIARDTIPAEMLKVLVAAGIIVARFSFYDSFELVDQNTRLIALLLGVEARGNIVLDDMWQRLAKVEQAVQEARRPRLLWYNTMSRSTGPGTLNDEMIERAGAFNIVRETGQSGSVDLPQEMAISMQPEVIILGSYMTGEQDRAFMMSSPAWQNVPAVRNRRVHVINSAWGTTGSPYRVRGVEQLASIIHPERFSL